MSRARRSASCATRTGTPRRTTSPRTWTRSRSRRATTPTSGRYRYIALNTTVKPFDNPDVRRAILAAFDRNALRQAFGGELTGDIPTHFIPPGQPGFEEAGGDAGPGVDF